MKRFWLASLCSVALVAEMPRLLWGGPACAATPAAAVLEQLGVGGGTETREGFRVRDVVVDPVLRRSFVRVESCTHVERPLILLPFAAAAALPGEHTLASPVRTELTANLVPVGSSVRVGMADERIRLNLQGRLLRAAAIGGVVDVQLPSMEASGSAWQTARHIHGRLIAADQVEVQP